MSDYKPTEHDGLRQDGQPDKRVGTGEFGGGDPVELGKKGGQASGTTGGSDSTGSTGSSGSSGSSGSDYKPTEHDGLRKDGQPDGRVKGN